jgi:hypothetical protein
MPFFYRRKPKPPSSTIFVPLLKLFKTTHQKNRREDTEVTKEIPLDIGSPFLLSGPKSQYGLGISLHFILIPQPKQINQKIVWKFAREEMRNALILEGLDPTEAEMYTLRLIDPLVPPPEIRVELSEEDKLILENFQYLITYQLLQGQKYSATLESIRTIYKDLADTFISLANNQTPANKEAGELFDGFTFRNIEVAIYQGIMPPIEKKTIIDLIGKLKEIAKFFEIFAQDRYLKRSTPQTLKIIHRLYP